MTLAITGDHNGKMYVQRTQAKQKKLARGPCSIRVALPGQ
jgi:hypothetical protein